MNRNTESHFAQLPAAEIQRSTFDRSASYKTSFNAGRLIPFYVEEVLPGDTFDITTSKIVRSQTMLTPVMDNMYLDTYYFFVPNRLIWAHWREFCGENTQGPWAPTVSYRMPTIASPEGGFAVGTIADYMGLPVGVTWKADDDLAPTSLPFRAYSLICNEFFRDENLSDPLLTPTDDANSQGVNTGNYVTDCALGGLPFRPAKYHDYFTSALPAPQKATEPVGIPIDVPGFNGGVFPVVTKAEVTPLPAKPMVMWVGESNSGNDYTVEKGTKRSVYLDGTNGTYHGGNDPATSGFASAAAPANLYVDIPKSGNSSTIGFDVNEMRLAFAYQRFLESLARNGSRYTELLLGLFGVRSPDARLQRPEYLGGNRVPVNVSEVTNTAQAEQDFLGDLGAKSTTSDVNHDFVKSFTEHGYLIGLMCIRYDHSYHQGFQRFWMRKKFTDFYNPKFAHLGEVPVWQAEIYTDGRNLKPASGEEQPPIFGYQEIWADYRYRPNMVTGEMRPGVTNTLATWNLADQYAAAPTLSDGWIRESVDNVDRVLAVTSSVANQFWADIYVRNKCTRPMPMYSIPGLIDHF